MRLSEWCQTHSLKEFMILVGEPVSFNNKINNLVSMTQRKEEMNEIPNTEMAAAHQEMALQLAEADAPIIDPRETPEAEVEVAGQVQDTELSEGVPL